MLETSPLFWPLQITLGTLVVSLVLVFLRLVRGPSLADRAVAVDMISYLAIGLVAVFTLWRGQAAYLDAAIILGLLAFLATVAFGRYIEQTATDHPLTDED